MKSAVITFPGSNCNRDMAVALEKITGNKPEMVWHQETNFSDVDFIALPGGFSFGDYLRCGAISARSNVMKEIVKRAKAGVPTFGVCNGFQVLTETELLPGALMRNAGLRFVCRDVHLRVDNNTSMFSNAHDKGEVIKIPVAHHDGNYFASEDKISALEDEGRVVFRYCDANGDVTKVANVNGSINNIAGVVNRKGNVLGMMPHPERMIEPALGGSDGVKLFQSVLNTLG